MLHRVIGLLFVATAVIFALLSCSGSNSGGGAFFNTVDPEPTAAPAPASAVAFSATVHRTEGGIAHIIAEDFGSLGFGAGYAAAEDNFCALAKNLLKFRAQQSEFLGPDGGNLNTDLFYKYLIDTGLYDVEINAELDTQFSGYAAGFNRYLRDTGIDKLPDASCRGAEWIQAMTAEDVRRVHLTPAFLPRLAVLFLGASPPVATASSNSPAQSIQNSAKNLALVDEVNAMATARDKGSNAVAIGADLSNHDGGLLFANPHLDWDLGFRFYPMHHIIPGVLNQLGANTWERAHVGFGTNGDIAWTNTVTTSRTQSLYELELIPGNPTQYMYDGETRDMTATEVNVNVLGDDGAMTEESHTFYESHHGLIMGLVFEWTETSAFALRIANEGARGMQGGSLAMARSTTVGEFRNALAEYQSSPSINNIAADKNGDAFYGDLGPVVNLTDQQLVDCATPTAVSIGFFAPAFFGNTSDCEWNTDADSAAPGLLGAAQQASLIRRDYVTNSNSSFWLANPNAPITGIPQVQGDIETERSLRTRSGLRMIQERIDGSDGLAGTTFDLDSLLQQMLSNQSEAGLLLRDDLVTLCTSNPSVIVEGSAVDISTACPVLAAWDLRANLDSRGAHLFREFMRAANGGSASNRTLPTDLNYAVPFDANDPVNTPRGLDTGSNPVALNALAQAVRRLTTDGVALDAALGDLQSVTRNGTRIPLHGGDEQEGIFNKMTLGYADGEYPEVSGSSGTWIMGTEFTPEGVRAKGILTYSVSLNPDSAHYSDMTELFSSKTLIDLPYTQEDVEAASISSSELSEGTDQCADEGWQAFEQQEFASETECRDYFVALADNRLTNFVD